MSFSQAMIQTLLDNSRASIRFSIPTERGTNSEKQEEDEHWWEDSKIVISFPKCSTFLSYLTGSDVIKLANRSFMLKLENALKVYSENELKQRAEKRKAAEIKRLDKQYFGKSILDFETISTEIMNHPIFQILRKVKYEEKIRRAKFTNKKEIFFQKKLKEMKKRKLLSKHQEMPKIVYLGKPEKKLFEEKNESLLGLNLLKIHDDHWVDCELDLKEFLEKEHERYLAHKKTLKQKRQSYTKLLDEKMRKKQKTKSRDIIKEKLSKYDSYSLQDTSSSSIESPNVVFRPFDKIKRMTISDSMSYLDSVSSQSVDEIQSRASMLDALTFREESRNFDDIIIRPKYEDPRIVQLKSAPNMYEFIQQMEKLILNKDPIDEEISDENEEENNE